MTHFPPEEQSAYEALLSDLDNTRQNAAHREEQMNNQLNNLQDDYNKARREANRYLDTILNFLAAHPELKEEFWNYESDNDGSIWEAEPYAGSEVQHG